MARIPSTSSLEEYFRGYLDSAPIAFVISTIGHDTSRYIRANNAYLQLCGKTWRQINGGDLLTTGSAISSPERDRRLWLLDNIGHYKNEVATIRHSNGRLLNVILSAQRHIIDGVALDFEFMMPICFL